METAGCLVAVWGVGRTAQSGPHLQSGLAFSPEQAGGFEELAELLVEAELCCSLSQQEPLSL